MGDLNSYQILLKYCLSARQSFVYSYAFNSKKASPEAGPVPGRGAVRTATAHGAPRLKSAAQVPKAGASRWLALN